MTKKVKVILKHSSIEDKIPTAEQLEVGELALNNFKDKEFLSFKNTEGEIVKISPSGNKEVIENLQNQISGVTSALTNYELSSAHTRDIRNVSQQISSIRENTRKLKAYPDQPDYLFDTSGDHSRDGVPVEPFQNALQYYFYKYLKGRLDSNSDTDIRQGLSEFFKENLQTRGNKYTQNFVDGLDAYMQMYAFNLYSNASIYQYLTGSTDVITKSKLEEFNYANAEKVNNDFVYVKSLIPQKTSQLSNDSNYVTKTDLDKKLDSTAYTAPDLSSYAKKSDIPTVPTKTSELTNDSGFITGVDLSDYATTTQLATKLDATAYTPTDLSSYAKKTDIPSVPTKTSQLTNDSGYITGVDLSSYDTISDVNSKLDKKLDSTAYTVPDLSSYAKKSDIPTVPTKTSQLSNDSGYITGVDLSNYDTITDVNSKLSTKLDATAYTSPDLSSYAKKSDIPTVPTKTSQLTNDSGFITGVDLSNYDTITDVDSKLEKKLDATAYTAPDLSSYAKKSDIPTVPTKTSQLTNDSHYTKKVELTQAAYNALTSKDEDTIYVITDSNVDSLSSDVLKEYAKKTDLPTKTSELTNDSNFITGVDLSNYATTTQLAEKQDKVNNLVVGKTASYTLQSVTESEWESLSGSAESNTIYFIK